MRETLSLHPSGQKYIPSLFAFPASSAGVYALHGCMCKIPTQNAQILLDLPALLVGLLSLGFTGMYPRLHYIFDLCVAFVSGVTPSPQTATMSPPASSQLPFQLLVASRSAWSASATWFSGVCLLFYHLTFAL